MNTYPAPANKLPCRPLLCRLMFMAVCLALLLVFIGIPYGREHFYSISLPLYLPKQLLRIPPFWAGSGLFALLFPLVFSAETFLFKAPFSIPVRVLFIFQAVIQTMGILVLYIVMTLNIFRDISVHYSIVVPLVVYLSLFALLSLLAGLPFATRIRPLFCIFRFRNELSKAFPANVHRARSTSNAGG